VDTPDASYTLYPTFKYQGASDIPTFTLMVTNKSRRLMDFDPAAVQASLDNVPGHVYSLEERVGEIQSSAKRKQLALAIMGGLAAGAAAYNASHTTTTYSGYATNYRGNSVFVSGSVRTYDPAQGMLAGAAVGAATGVGIKQIANAAGYQVQAAQAIWARATIAPATTQVGQIEIKRTGKSFGTVRIAVNGARFIFLKSTSVY
jgi:hypothetical protein